MSRDRAGMSSWKLFDETLKNTDCLEEKSSQEAGTHLFHSEQLAVPPLQGYLSPAAVQMSLRKMKSVIIRDVSVTASCDRFPKSANLNALAELATIYPIEFSCNPFALGA